MTNQNPARITDASWRYIEARLALDPGDAVYSGSYVNKPGYHGTRSENQARDRIDGSVDYSVRLPQDLRGPADKTAGYDFKYKSAAAGNFAPMARRGAYVLRAFNARDPRLLGWREWLGQTDVDKTPEGLDFVTWTKRVPDPTHEWHDHDSELREYVESWINKECMLSILAGETLDAYLARGGRLVNGQGGNVVMAYADAFLEHGGDTSGPAVAEEYRAKPPTVKGNSGREQIWALRGELAKARADIKVLLERPAAVVDVAALASALKPMIESAVREALNGATIQSAA